MRIEVQEGIDRRTYVSSMLDAFPKCFSDFYEMPIECHVDVEGWVDDKCFYTEIKEMNDFRDGKRLPYHLLRVDKLDRILKYGGSEAGKVYAVISAEEDIITLYNLKKMDFSKYEVRVFNLHATEFDRDSKIVPVPCYMIPRTDAYKIIPKYEPRISFGSNVK